MTTTDEPLWDIAQTAEFLGVKVQTLYWWRHRNAGEGPLSVKVGRFVKYVPADVRRYLDDQKAGARR